jgi:hypothetical protein
MCERVGSPLRLHSKCYFFVIIFSSYLFVCCLKDGEKCGGDFQSFPFSICTNGTFVQDLEEKIQSLTKSSQSLDEQIHTQSCRQA